MALEIALQYGLYWKCDLAVPVSSEKIAIVEHALGVALPSSLKAFYSTHNGFELTVFDNDQFFGNESIAILKLEHIVAQTRADVRYDLEAFDENSENLITIGYYGPERIVLAISDSLASGEYPVRFISRDSCRPEPESRNDNVSFHDWLRLLLKSITTDKKHPILGIPLSKSSSSPEYFHEKGIRALSDGDPARAWNCLLDAICRRLNDQPGYLRDLNVLEFIGGANSGEIFLLRLLRRLGIARSIDFEHGSGVSGFPLYVKPEQQQFESLKILPIFSALANSFGDLTLFNNSRFSAPFEHCDAALTIFAGDNARTSRSNAFEFAIQDGLLCEGMRLCGEVGSAMLAAFDLVFVEAATLDVFIAPYRNYDGLLPKPRLQGGLRRLNLSLDTFLDRALDRYIEGLYPQDFI